MLKLPNAFGSEGDLLISPDKMDATNRPVLTRIATLALDTCCNLPSSVVQVKLFGNGLSPSKWSCKNVCAHVQNISEC